MIILAALALIIIYLFGILIALLALISFIGTRNYDKSEYFNRLRKEYEEARYGKR